MLYKWKRPPLYPKQEAAVFDPARYSVIEASTKSGKTTGCLIWLLELAWKGTEGSNYWWVAPVTSQSEIAFSRMKIGLPREVYTANEVHDRIDLRNGAHIWFKSADNPDTLYGENVMAAVIDEATRVKESSWHAVRSTLTHTRGPVRIIGNVQGRRNWAYKLARRAQAGEQDMAYHKITANDAVEADILDAREIEDARRTLPENVFRELYLAEPSDDEGNPFGVSAIAACIKPLSDWPAIAWGWDLAKSVDYTVGIGLDARGFVARFERFQTPWSQTKKRIKTVTGNIPADMDSTGVGDPILEELQLGGMSVTGYKFTSPSKQMLMERLACAIQQQEIGFPDGPIRLELESFEYEYHRMGVYYRAPQGSHDDCVCALALAWNRWQYAFRPAASNVDYSKGGISRRKGLDFYS